MLLVDGAPAWAQRCQAPPGVQATALRPGPGGARRLRHGGRAPLQRQLRRAAPGPYWQGLNEPNLSLFFYPQYDGDKPVSPHLYRTLINAFYAAIKAVDSSNMVIAAGLGPIAVPQIHDRPDALHPPAALHDGAQAPRADEGELRRRRPLRHLRHPPLHDRRAHPRRWDRTTSSSATWRSCRRCCGPPTGPDGSRAAFAHTPLWITEFSWDSKPPDPGGLPMKILTRWTAEALYRAWRVGVEPFLLVQPAGRPLRTEPPLQRNPPVRPLFPRADASPKTSRRKSSTPSGSPSSPTRARRASPSGAARRPAAAAGSSIQILKGGHWRTRRRRARRRGGHLQGRHRQPLRPQQDAEPPEPSTTARPRRALLDAPGPDFLQPPFG